MDQPVDGWPRRGANGSVENQFGGKAKLGHYGGDWRRGLVLWLHNNLAELTMHSIYSVRERSL
jgi:hypothetical protein